MPRPASVRGVTPVHTEPPCEWATGCPRSAKGTVHHHELGVVSMCFECAASENLLVTTIYVTPHEYDEFLARLEEPTRNMPKLRELLRQERIVKEMKEMKEMS